MTVSENANQNDELVEATATSDTWKTNTGVSFGSEECTIVISDIDPSGPFQDAPLTIGSEVVSINGMPCKGYTPEDCTEIISDLEGEAIIVTRNPSTNNEPQVVSEEGEMNYLTKESTLSKVGDLIECELTEDVYSLIYTASARSAGFSFAIFVFLFQMAVISLVLWDLLNHFNRGVNPLNIPPGATPQVQTAMALALLLAVATQEDLIVAVTLLHQGYSKRVLERNPSATRFKWLLSCLGQFIAGGSLLFTIFLLVMQSSTVIGMMLNFAALSFIAEIDDVAFSLAKNGFITDAVEREANYVCQTTIPSRKKSNTLRRVMFLAVFAGLMVGYGILIHQQRSGKFLCQSIYLQLGDGFYAVAPYFSGLYDQTDKIINGRVTYIDRHSNQVMLGYCEEENAWTLTLYDPPSNENPCKEWSVRSPQTESFDIVATSNEAWLIDAETGVNPLQTFLLTCADCDSGGSKVCNGNGQCVDNSCVCNQGWYGRSCEFPWLCQKLAVDGRTNTFLDYEYLSDEYDLLLGDDGAPVEVYGRPVYAFRHQGLDEYSDEYWSVLFFSGRRWIASASVSNLFNVTGYGIPANATRTELIEFLEAYHGVFNPIVGLYISDPMDVGTPSDAFSPVGLGWYGIKDNTDEGFIFNEIDPSQPASTSLLCAVCDDGDENGCFFGGSCVGGECFCVDGLSEGVLCEILLEENETTTDGV